MKFLDGKKIKDPGSHISKPMNEQGMAHYIIVLAFIVVFGVVGTYLYVRSHADTPAAIGCPTPTINQSVNNHCGPTPTTTYSTRHWLIAESAAQALKSNSPTGSNFVKTINNGATYEIINQNGAGANDPLPNSIHVESFKSLATIQTAFTDKQVPSNVKVILYDDEDWTATPKAEQEHPFTYVPEAEQLVHTHNLRFMNAPATDLTAVLDPAAANNYAGYLNMKLASLAKYSDIFEIQAQNATSVTQYTSFANSAVTEARSANPSALVLLGVTAKVGGPTAQELVSEVNNTKQEVDGYWLNILGGDTSVALPLIEAWK